MRKKPRLSFFSILTAFILLVIISKSFVTPKKANAVGSSTPFRFVSWADTKTGTTALTNESKAVNALNPAFTLYPGDLIDCTSSTNPACFSNGFSAWKTAFNGGGTNNLFTKSFITRGNHDDNANTPWLGNFEFATVASTVGATNYTEQSKDLTYSFDYGNSHFVGIDVPKGAVTNISAAQVTWLDNDLAAAEGRGLTHAFLFWHGPIYPMAEHCCTDKPSTALATVLAKHPIISATFHGHEHVIAYKHITSAIIPGLTKPFEEFISGDAGAGPEVMTAGRADSWLSSTGWTSSGNMNTAHGFVSVDVNCNNYTVSIHTENGAVAKTYSFSNGSGGCGTNPTPTSTGSLISPTPAIPTPIYVTPTIYCMGSCPTLPITPTTGTPSNQPPLSQSPVLSQGLMPTAKITISLAPNPNKTPKPKKGKSFFQIIKDFISKIIQIILQFLLLLLKMLGLK